MISSISIALLFSGGFGIQDLRASTGHSSIHQTTLRLSARRKQEEKKKGKKKRKKKILTSQIHHSTEVFLSFPSTPVINPFVSQQRPSDRQTPSLRP